MEDLIGKGFFLGVGMGVGMAVGVGVGGMMEHSRSKRKREDVVKIQKGWPPVLDPIALLAGGKLSPDPMVQSPVQCVEPGCSSHLWLFGDPMAGSFRLIRKDEYSEIWKRFQEKMTTISLLIGHPGIGKSFSLDVFLAFSLHSSTKTCWLCVTAAGDIHFLWKEAAKNQTWMKTMNRSDGPVQDDVIQECRDILRESGKDHLTIFHDPGSFPLDGLPMAVVALLKDVKVNIMTAYPFHLVEQRGNYHSKWIRDNSSLIERYWVPVLTSEEAEKFFERVYPALSKANPNLFVEVWLRTGGVPRSIEDLKLDQEKDPDKAIAERDKELKVWIRNCTLKSNTLVSAGLAYRLPSVDRKSASAEAIVSQKALELFIHKDL